jgi:predicted membrane metal-binding protein
MTGTTSINTERKKLYHYDWHNMDKHRKKEAVPLLTGTTWINTERKKLYHSDWYNMDKHRKKLYHYK